MSRDYVETRDGGYCVVGSRVSLDSIGWKAVDRLIGVAKDAPPDLSENHDACLYG